MEVFIDLRTLAELLDISYEAARKYRHHTKDRADTGFPEPWGTVHKSGRGSRTPVFALSEILDWIAINKPYHLRIALEFGNVGQELGRLEERHSSRVASKASKVT